MLTPTSKQSMLSSMIEKRIRQGAEPVARADADVLEVVILTELGKIGVNQNHTSLYAFIDEVRACRLNALIEARTAAVADRMVASSKPVSDARKGEYFAAAVASGFSVGIDAKLSEFLGDAPAPAAALDSAVAGEIGQGDLLVVTVPYSVSRERRDRMCADIRKELGCNVRILIADGGTTIAVMAAPAAGEE